MSLLFPFVFNKYHSPTSTMAPCTGPNLPIMSTVLGNARKILLNTNSNANTNTDPPIQIIPPHVVLNTSTNNIKLILNRFKVNLKLMIKPILTLLINPSLYLTEHPFQF